MLMTLAPLSVAYPIAATISLNDADQSSANTLSAMIFVFHEAPATPAPLLPRAAAVPATSVPCGAVSSAAPF
jgi:hypothetical protein